MSTTDKVATQCEKQIVNGIDFLARNYDLRRNPVALATILGTLGIGDNDAAIIERYINKQRKDAGKKALKSGTIKSSSTIQDVLTHGC